MKDIAVNRQAKFNYFILDTFEAGIVLEGCEVKSLRAGHCVLNDSFVKVISNEVYLINCNIPMYEKTTDKVLNTTRSRKLLLHKSEIEKLKTKAMQKSLTIVPLRIYFSGKNVKLEIALAKGKQLFDKKETIKERDLKREADGYKKQTLS